MNPLAISTALKVGSTLLSAKGSREDAAASRRAAEAEARQFEKRADQEQEYGARQAIEVRRSGDLLKSDATAAMVASGGTTTDVGAMRTLSDITGTVNHNALAALFMGRQAALQSRQSAATVRAGGRAQASAYRMEAGATILRGATSIASDLYQPTEEGEG